MNEHATVLIRMSPELVKELSEGMVFDEGEVIRWEFSEPDEVGLCSAVIYRTAPTWRYRLRWVLGR